MTRQEALAAGLTQYFTGKPCKHGHVANRYVANWTCVVCFSARAIVFQRKWRAKNAAKQQKYRAKYAEKHSESNKIWREANPEKCKLYRLKSYAKNKVKRLEDQKQWRSENKDAMQAHKAKRRADILNRTPKWLNSDEKWMIQEVYRLALLRTKITGVTWHVDHILPLRGRLVSGLHTPYNLQVIPAESNLRKGNSYAPS